MLFRLSHSEAAPCVATAPTPVLLAPEYCIESRTHAPRWLSPTATLSAWFVTVGLHPPETATPLRRPHAPDNLKTKRSQAASGCRTCERREKRPFSLLRVERPIFFGSFSLTTRLSLPTSGWMPIHFSHVLRANGHHVRKNRRPFFRQNSCTAGKRRSHRHDASQNVRLCTK